MHRLNIRWRLTLWFCAAMTALLVGRSFWIYYMMERRLTATTDAELNADLSSLESAIASAADRAKLAQAFEQFSAGHGDVAIEAIAPDQEVLYSKSVDEPAAALLDAKTTKNSRRFSTQVTANGGQVRAAAESFPSSLGTLAVRISRSMQAERQDAWDFALLLLTTGPMVILASLGVGYLVSSRAMAPVDAMISAANDITANRLDQRIEAPDTGDELARLAQTFNAMIDRLHKAFEEMRQFTADAAHDLRTPVAALRTEIEVSLMADRTAEEYRHSMQTALDEAIQLSRLTAQLLDLSREDHGGAAGQEEMVRVDLLLEGVIDDLRLAAAQQSIAVKLPRMESVTVAGDPVRLRRVFMNLLENAIRYTPAGGEVRVEAARTTRGAQITISDNGPGIPPEHLPHLFDRFRRVDQARSREFGGTGLGLAISKSIVEAHGGAIVMESTVGQGTCVRVTLPMGETALVPARLP